MQSLWQDLRFAARLLIKDRWVTLAAVVALALGIGVTNTVFTLVNTVVLRDLPFDRPDRVMWLGTRDARGRDLGVSYLDFQDWRSASRSFSAMTMVTSPPLNLSDDETAPEQVAGAYVSAAAFPIIGERAPTSIGRAFVDEDDRPGAPAVVILSDKLWKRRYNGDAAVIGRTIRISGLQATVIGVMREGLNFPFNNDLWLPLAQSPLPRAEGRQVRSRPVFARLADGVTIAQARAELEGIAAQLARDHADTNKDIVPTIAPYAERLIGPQIRLLFWSLMGAVVFVLLIACANVANLLLARAAHRSKEISVRVSLGATRWRIVRQLLVESVLLAVISGVVGLGLSVLGVRWFDAATQDVGRPYWMVFNMDARVFGVFAAACLLTGIIFGLAPALHISKTNVNEVLKEGGGRSGSGGLRTRRWTAGLIIAELTLTLVLLAGAGFMMRSFLALYRVDLGIDTSRILTMQLRMPPRQYPNPERQMAFLRRVDERIRAIPTLQAASTTSNLPFGFGQQRQLTLDGRPAAVAATLPTVTVVSVGSRYFEVLGLQLVRGRGFDDSDGSPGHESAIVNRQFVAMHFPNEDPLGKRIRLTMPDGPATPATPQQPAWLTIVGVTPTVRQNAFRQTEQDPVVYLPHLGTPNMTYDAMLIVRAPSDPGKIASLLREEMRALDPDMPLFNIRTLDEALAQLRWPSRTFGTMFAIFALIALVLSAVGLYGVTAYSVTQRTQEIGVRMALGAEPRQISWLILRRGLIQIAIGLVLGFAGAVGVGRLLRSLLIQTSPTDPTTLAAIVFVLIAVAVAACLWPARQATRLDPNAALRYE